MAGSNHSSLQTVTARREAVAELARKLESDCSIPVRDMRAVSGSRKNPISTNLRLGSSPSHEKAGSEDYVGPERSTTLPVPLLTAKF
jgi:hypothetical protein